MHLENSEELNSQATVFGGTKDLSSTLLSTTDLLTQPRSVRQYHKLPPDNPIISTS